MDEYWIIEWRARGDRAQDIKEVARTAAAALSTIERLLAGEIAVDEDSDCPTEVEQPAFEALFGEDSPKFVLEDLDEPIEQECENGTLIVTPCRTYGPGKRRIYVTPPAPPSQSDCPRGLDEAAPQLLAFARLFLAYHNNMTDDDVTIQTLERAARHAVAKAEGLLWKTPLTEEMIQELKDDYLNWTPRRTRNKPPAISGG